VCVFPLHTLLKRQYYAKYGTVLWLFEASGNKDPEIFGCVIGTELILQYMCIHFHNDSTVMDLVIRELGDEGVEGDATSGCPMEERKPPVTKRGLADNGLLEAILGNSAVVDK